MRRGMSLTNSELLDGTGKEKKIPTMKALFDKQKENLGTPNSVRSHSVGGREVSEFDTSKWKKIVIGNVEMVQKKVD